MQYLNDIDPFSASTNFPEPARPPLYTLNVNIPLINQIAGIHRVLKAPHKVKTNSILTLTCLDYLKNHHSHTCPRLLFMMFNQRLDLFIYLLTVYSLYIEIHSIFIDMMKYKRWKFLFSCPIIFITDEFVIHTQFSDVYFVNLTLYPLLTVNIRCVLLLFETLLFFLSMMQIPTVKILFI